MDITGTRRDNQDKRRELRPDAVVHTTKSGDALAPFEAGGDRG